LYKEGAFFGVQTNRKPVQQYLFDGLLRLFCFLKVVGENLKIGNNEETVVLVLKSNPILQ